MNRKPNSLAKMTDERLPDPDRDKSNENEDCCLVDVEHSNPAAKRIRMARKQSAIPMRIPALCVIFTGDVTDFERPRIRQYIW